MTAPESFCPFCARPAAGGKPCPGCRRDPSAPRRVCPGCKRLTPKAEGACMHCARPFHSEMWWKLPLIIGLFILAMIVSFLLALAR